MTPSRSFPARAVALAALAAVLGGGITAAFFVRAADNPAAGAAADSARPALSVTLVRPERAELVTTIDAGGNVAAWQEAVVGAEANGLRLAEVRVNVGDTVRRGQVLAIFAPELVSAELAQSRAAVAEAEAALAEAAANAARARELEASGALSAQQIAQLLTAERTAAARLEAVKAVQQLQQLRLKQTQVLAPDAGVISARSATVGAVLPAGAELFRLIRQGRLEWRAEVGAQELARIRPGQTVRLDAAGGGEPVEGRVRMLAPTVDPATRNALVYVDLPAGSALRAGMFARGEFVTGRSTALTLPPSAVLLRDGFSYVFTVGEGNRVSQVKVAVGRRSGERVEIVQGLDANARVVASGGGFLADGDVVRVVQAAPVARTAASVAAPAKATN